MSLQLQLKKHDLRIAQDVAARRPVSHIVAAPTTRQLAFSESRRNLRGIELAVDELIEDTPTYAEVMRRVQRAYLRRTLVRACGNVSKASAIASVHRNTFARLLSSSGIRYMNQPKLKQPNTAPAVAARQTRRAA